jgi:hypothetical protein
MGHLVLVVAFYFASINLLTGMASQSKAVKVEALQQLLLSSRQPGAM